MTRPRPFPRRRPGEPDQENSAPTATAAPSGQEQDLLDPAVLLRQHLSVSTLTASSVAAMPAEQGSAPGATTQEIVIGQQWRTRLSEIGKAAGLSDAQEAEFERLARAQLDRIRETIPRLLNELKPHFDTPEEGAAKQRYETGLRTLKSQLDQETSELLHGFGFSQTAD